MAGLFVATLSIASIILSVFIWASSVRGSKVTTDTGTDCRLLGLKTTFSYIWETTFRGPPGAEPFSKSKK